MDRYEMDKIIERLKHIFELLSSVYGTIKSAELYNYECGLLALAIYPDNDYRYFEQFCDTIEDCHSIMAQIIED